MKYQVKTVDAFEGPAYNYIGDDGYPKGVIVPVIIATDANGKMFQLPNQVKLTYDEEGFGPYPKLHFTLAKARELKDKILDIGIDLALWVEVTETDVKDYLRSSYGPAC